MDDMAKRGRPSLGVKSTNVRLPGDVRERITALVGERGMAQFMREAAENELARREPQEKQKPAKRPRA